MIVYFLVSFGLIVASFVVFHENLLINQASLAPAVLILVSIIQAMIFKSYNKVGYDDFSAENTAYTVHEIDREAYRSGMKWHSICKMVILPPMLLFCIFFPSNYKIILSIALYIISYFPVYFLVKLEKKKKHK